MQDCIKNKMFKSGSKKSAWNEEKRWKIVGRKRERVNEKWFYVVVVKKKKKNHNHTEQERISRGKDLLSRTGRARTETIFCVLSV